MKSCCVVLILLKFVAKLCLRGEGNVFNNNKTVLGQGNNFVIVVFAKRVVLLKELS